MFLKGRSAVDQIFTMRQILEKYWEQNVDVHHLYFDLQAAYDYMEERNVE
jgi:hypothetical protein